MKDYNRGRVKNCCKKAAYHHQVSGQQVHKTQDTIYGCLGFIVGKGEEEGWAKKIKKRRKKREEREEKKDKKK